MTCVPVLKHSDTVLDCIKDGWFTEDCELLRRKSGIAGMENALNASNGNWKSLYTGEQMSVGQRFSLQVEKVLAAGKSDFQDILVFRSSHYGNVLALDGCIQVTELDECGYQEMITHIPMFTSPKPPKRVLIIGGGDGGVLREVLKHSSVECVQQCEIDQLVVEMSKTHFSATLATSFCDPRVTMIYKDAVQYCRELNELNSGLSEEEQCKFDCIICDSSDPVGPAADLFTPAFYRSMSTLLSDQGVIVTQGECQWLYLDLIASVLSTCGEIFPSTRYAFSSVPSYPSGQIGFILCSNSTDVDFEAPVRSPVSTMSLEYYTPAVHRAAFALPAFAARRLPQKYAKCDGTLPASV